MTLSRIQKQSLDSHITGSSFIWTEEKKVLHYCSICGREKRIPMFYELGGWFYPNEAEDDAYCCGQDMEIATEEEGR